MTQEEIRAELKQIAPDATILTCDVDGEQSVEWICSRGRLGFVLDKENTSSWFMVTLDGLSKSDYIGAGGIELVRELGNEFKAALI